MDPIVCLPVEVVVYMLSFLGPRALSRCRTLSTAWNSVCSDPFLWSTAPIRCVA